MQCPLRGVRAQVPPHLAGGALFGCAAHIPPFFPLGVLSLKGAAPASALPEHGSCGAQSKECALQPLNKGCSAIRLKSVSPNCALSPLNRYLAQFGVLLLPLGAAHFVPLSSSRLSPFLSVVSLLVGCLVRLLFCRVARARPLALWAAGWRSRSTYALLFAQKSQKGSPPEERERPPKEVGGL